MSKHKSGDPWADIYSVLAVVTQSALAFHIFLLTCLHLDSVASWMDGSFLLQSTGRHLVVVATWRVCS